MQQGNVSSRDFGRVIIHFDYDAFYASVVEAENPALKSVPLAIQQKQIIVTCNYEARRLGLHKLQLITEAKKVCPDVVIILGEDLTRFRNASKDLYNFLKERIWSNRAERLGFDEVWLDCTDMVDFNLALLNHNDLQNSFFCMDREDPTQGFAFDARGVFGPTYPRRALDPSMLTADQQEARLRLVLGSHLAQRLRHELDIQKGYTSTVGIAHNKVLSKLVGNVNKPKNQTTLVPPFDDYAQHEGTVHQFMDAHDIGKVPGIGFKLAQKVRGHVLGREATRVAGLVYGVTQENVTVRDVRLHPGMGPDKLEEILSGPGSQKGIGGKMWSLINGEDDSEVGKVKRVPSQISQEDSYMKYLHTFEQVRHQLFLLADRLIKRMRIDLMEDDDDDDVDVPEQRANTSTRWMAHPRTLRLATRPRPPLNANGTRSRTFNRISHSAPLPNFVFAMNETTDVIAERLVEKALVTMFRKLHPERHGWNLSLINIAVANMAETAADTKDSDGRDIGRMFRRQEDVLKDYKIVQEDDNDLPFRGPKTLSVSGSVDYTLRPEPEHSWQEPCKNDWESSDDGNELDAAQICHVCNQRIPIFAADAHTQFHKLSD